MLVAVLPVTERKDEILAAIRDHQVVIVAGETGSGKSTQLPQLCLELGRGVDGMIGHTQPRRLAARTIAERVAEELGTTVGGAVGYTVRFTDRVGPDTRIKVMTDGILLAEIQRDRELRAYDTLIVDEAHERSLNVDFLLGYLRQLLPRRPDLKVVITSATIDTARFAQHFDAPVIEVTGRTYPVEVRYRPVEDDPIQAVVDAVGELEREGPGDVLVFLSGEREIRDTADALRGADLRHTEIVPLYARLTAAEQHRVFEQHTGRRVVLATNVAETSLTVPGIRSVVDLGTARISRFHRRTKVQRLPIEPISQASANQRAGRCGRTGPGVCIRLYAEDDLAKRPEFTDPEILRTNLASVILQMHAIGLGDIAAFPFLEPPDGRAIKDGIALLEELGALDSDRLTKLGRRLARLPLDPRLGRMVLEAERHGCVHDVMVIAAALSIQDPRERPSEKRQAADELHARFRDDASDFVGILNLWDHLRGEQKRLSSNQFRKRCKAEYLNWLRVREWQDVYSQLLHATREQRVHVNRDRAAPDAIHRALLAGLLSHVGMRVGDDRDYLGPRNSRFALSSASTLAKKRPRWVMAAELVETNRVWAHTAARIQPEWAEQAGAHLVQRTYSEPHWDRTRGAVTAFERVTLYGLPLVVGRRVDYGRVDPDGARELFIQHALVDGEWDATHAFVVANDKLRAEGRALEDRARRRDLLIDDEALFRFFDDRVPGSITSTRHFDRWWKEERPARPDLLTLTPDVLFTGSVEASSYPDTWALGGDAGVALPLTYVFEPGDDDDGVTVDVPVRLLDRLDGAGFDWQVPGLRPELVAALLRGLPKALRRAVVPVPETAARFLAAASPGDGPLTEVLARFIDVDPNELGPATLPPHLRMTIRVVDGAGRVLARGKRVAEVRAAVVARQRAALGRAARPYERGPASEWVFGDIPRTVEVPWEGTTVTGYPALVDENDGVALRVLASPAEQSWAMWRGTRRLLLLTIPSPRKFLGDRLTKQTKVALSHAPHDGPAALLDDCIACATDIVLADHGGPVWDASAFASLREHVRAELGDRAVGVVALVGRILASTRSIDERLGSLTAPGIDAAVADIHVQVARLVYPGFVTDTGAGRLPHVLRYLTAVERRIDKLPAQPVKDHELLQRVRRLEDALTGVRRHDDVARIRWLIEELRVSLFAQQLGTAQKVSEQRVTREIAAASRSDDRSLG
jgi:ATP-dependent helicase HrpA